jgi:hypothetical protein
MKIFIKDGGGLIVEGYVLAMENSRSENWREEFRKGN